MEKKNCLALCLFVVCATTMFMSSCSNDDDNGSKEKRLVEFGENVNDKFTITYDQQGRVSSFSPSRITDYSGSLSATYWGQTVTVEQTTNQGKQSLTYTLNEQGYVASCSDGRTFSYTDGYLTKISHSDYGDKVITYNSNHDVTEANDSEFRMTFTPSTTPIKGRSSVFTMFLMDNDHDYVIVLSGMTGKPMTHAPSTIVWLRDYERPDTRTYTYTLDSDGYISAVIEKLIEEEATGSISFVYEDIP